MITADGSNAAPRGPRRRAVGEQVLRTDAAGPALAEAAAARYADLRADPAIADLHGDFERINRRFLEAMT